MYFNTSKEVAVNDSWATTLQKTKARGQKRVSFANGKQEAKPKINDS